MTASLTWCKDLRSSWLWRRIEQVTLKAARNGQMDVWKRWQPDGRKEGTQRTSKGKVIPVFNPAPRCGGIQGSGVQRHAVLVTKLEGGRWLSDTGPGHITLVPSEQEAGWVPELGCRPYRQNKFLDNAGNGTPIFRSNRKLSTLIILMLICGLQVLEGCFNIRRCGQ